MLVMEMMSSDDSYGEIRLNTLAFKFGRHIS